MELEFLTINFSDMFITGIAVIILGFVSICLFFWFKGSSDKMNGDSIINQASSNKKKLKRKSNVNKLNKQTNNDDEIVEKPHKCKHIEIKSSPEIFEDSNKEIKPNIFVAPSKPILRKFDEEILIDEENYHETTWSKIPKDEVEVRRSRQSSVVSESRSIAKEELDETSSKLSRGQKKRLRIKLKTIEIKSGENKTNLSTAFSNSNEEFNCVEDNESISNKLNLTKSKKIPNKKPKNCPSNSTESSLGNEKLLSSSSLELEDKSLLETIVIDYKEESKNPEIINNNAPYGNHCDDDELETICSKIKTENKDLKQEIYELKQKLNDLSIMSATIGNLKKENEIYLKKQVDLERTCSAIQKELTNSLQKMNSAETRLVRMNTERNQQISYFENEIHKCNNKISILEADLRSKTTDNENLKMSVEQIRHLVSDKEQLLQNQNTELSFLNEQYYKTRKDYQEIELSANNITMKYKDLENQNQKLLDENQKMKYQMDSVKKENHKELEKFKMQIQNKERDQNSLISSLQYQIDEFQKEKQLSMFNSELDELRQENEKLKNMYAANRNNSCPSTPAGFELIETDKIKQITSKIIEGNRKLQEKCDQYNSLLSEKSDKENLLLEKNAKLEKDYSKLNKNLEEHLNEIVNLRTCIEKLQFDLSKNCENNFDDMKMELERKCETLRKTEEILTKLQVSVEDEEMRWNDLLSERIQDNEKLENELAEKNLVISNQNKKISELTSMLQSTNYPQMDSTLNGSLSVE